MNRCSLTCIAALAALIPLSPLLAQEGAARPRKEHKPQSEVAAKVAFATIPSDDATMKKALDAKQLDEAKKQIGKESAFKGTVTKVFTPKGNAVVILDFAPNFKEALTAVVKSESYAKFPDLNQLKGKRVLIAGKFEDFKGAPQIVLEKLEQVKLIK